MDSNRAEVGNLLKQIDDLQEARYKEDEDKVKEVFEEPPSLTGESKCTFRADAVARTDIQVRIQFSYQIRLNTSAICRTLN